MPDWIQKNPTAIDRGVKELDQIIKVVLETNVAGV